MAPEVQNFKRYALYFVAPGGNLSRFGASWLGWDPATGQRLAHPEIKGLPTPVSEITQSPRRYGFHGTIVPPFQPREEARQNVSFVHFTHEKCTEWPAVTLEGLELAQLGRFLALVPVGNGDALRNLAAQAVRAFDVLRAPLDEDDLARHRAKGLSPEQDRLLTRWGYPYVMEAFRFHITLTGKLPKAQARAVREVLEPYLVPLLERPFTISQLALMGEGADGYFHEIARCDLTG